MRENRRPGVRPAADAILAAVAVAGLLSLLADGAHAQYYGQNKVPQYDREWRILESEHFTLHFYPEEREVALETLPLAERAYARLSRILDHEFKSRIPVLLYGSQSEFRETRAAAGLISEGTLGLTEFMKRRVIVPFLGSFADLDHTLTHELVHAFQADMLSGSALGGSLTGMGWQPPLWVFEGMAEYLSTPGVDDHTAMWMREGVVAGALVGIEDLSRVMDIRVYRYGQSVMDYVGRNYGDESIGSWFQAMVRSHSVERATEEVTGLSLERLSRDWTDALRREYMPAMLTCDRAEDVARRLTDHEQGLATMYIAPAVSPDGGEMIYISNATPFSDLYLASALDGSHPRRLIRGERSESFETFRYLFTSLDWHPDGDRIVLVSKRGGEEQLFIFNVRDRKVERSFGFGLSEMIYPAWSPDGRRLVFSAVHGAHSDLYVVGADGDSLRALTDDRWAAYQPAWSPDGRRIAFLTDRDYCSAGCGPDRSPWKIAILDLATDSLAVLPGQYGKCINPQWFPDGRHLLFISDRSGASNLFVRDLETNADYQITNLLSGVSGITPTGTAASLSDNGHRVVFNVFEEGGWNLYAIRDPLALIEGREPWKVPEEPAAVVAAQNCLPPGGCLLVGGAVPAPDAGAAGGDSLRTAVETAAPAASDSLVTAEAGVLVGVAEPVLGDGDIAGADTLGVDSLGVDSLKADIAEIPGPGTPPEEIELAKVYAETAALPESLVFDERPYKTHLSIDYAAAGGLYASGYGMQAQSSIVFSDMLGDKNLYIAVDVNGAVEDGNYLVGYADLGSRLSFSAQAYQYWTGYGYSNLSAGTISDYERSFLRGLGFSWFRPYSRFRRVELSLDLVQEKRYTYSYVNSNYMNPLAYAWQERAAEEYYVRPEAAWVFDSAVWGPTGPLAGRRTRLSGYADVGQRNAHGVALDHRSYFNLRQRYAFVIRGVVAGEWGPDRRPVAFGGPYTMRGYTDRPLAGQQAAFANIEFRFPFIEGVLIAFPGPLLLGGIRGALFFDVGSAWDSGRAYLPSVCVGADCPTGNVRGSLGFRAAINLGVTILRWDLVRRTDLHHWDGKSFGEVSIGWEF
jgi:Tol biopolymer transport system component